MRCVRVRCRRCGHEGIPAGYCRTLWRRPKPKPSEMMNAHARESPPLSTQPSLPTCRQRGRAHHSTPSCAPYAAALTSRCRPSALLVLLTPMLHARLRPACRRSSASRPSRRVRWSARETSAHAEAPSLRGCAHVPAEVRWEREPPIARVRQTAWCRRQCGGARASSGVTPFLRYARRARCVAPFHSAPSLRQYLHVTNAGARAHSQWVYVLAAFNCVHARVRAWRTGAEPPCLPQVTQLKAAAAALSPMGATELEVGLYVSEQLLAAIEHAEAHLAAIDDDETVRLATLPNVDRQPLYTPRARRACAAQRVGLARVARDANRSLRCRSSARLVCFLPPPPPHRLPRKRRARAARPMAARGCGRGTCRRCTALRSSLIRSLRPHCSSSRRSAR